jgi:hypothetical protein
VDRRVVPEEFVVDLARRIKNGHITKEEALIALDLAAEEPPS